MNAHVTTLMSSLLVLAAAGSSGCGRGYEDEAAAVDQTAEVADGVHSIAGYRPALPANLRLVGTVDLRRFDNFEDGDFFHEVQGLGRFAAPSVQISQFERGLPGCHFRPGNTTEPDRDADVGGSFELVSRAPDRNVLEVNGFPSFGGYRTLFSDQAVPYGSRWNVSLERAPWSAHPSVGQTFQNVVRVPKKFSLKTPALKAPASNVILKRGQSFEITWDASSDVDNVTVSLTNESNFDAWVCSATQPGRIVIPATIVDNSGNSGPLVVWASHTELRYVGPNKALIFSGSRGSYFLTERQ